METRVDTRPDALRLSDPDDRKYWEVFVVFHGDAVGVTIANDVVTNVSPKIKSRIHKGMRKETVNKTLKRMQWPAVWVPTWR